jgi:hypothetical protein
VASKAVATTLGILGVLVFLSTAAATSTATTAETTTTVATVATAEPQQTPPQTPPQTLHRRIGIMNPDISINALMLYTNTNRGNYISSSERNGPALQSADLLFTADVDPYSKLTAVFGVHQEAATPREREDEWKIEPEELYVESLEIPSLLLRAGRFNAAVGKHNMLHLHAFPFVDAPLVNSSLLGDEGLNDVGLSAAWLSPLPWYMELTAQILSGRPEKDATGTAYFNNGSANASVHLLHLKNLFDLSDSLTAEIGLSGIKGSNEFPDEASINQIGATSFWGADLTFKWRPIEGGKYRSFVWSTEYLNRRINRPTAYNQAEGYASWLQYQFARRWWVQARSDYVQAAESAVTPEALDLPAFQRKVSALIGFFPSEFSGVRLQYSQNIDGKVDMDPEKKIYLQLNFSIGSHPAHTY